MWVKICANTNVEDALLAVEMGADALGFVFAPSKRRVTPVQVGEMMKQIPLRVETYGVFYTTEFNEIIRSMEVAGGLTGAQLHLPYESKLAEQLHGRGVHVMQTVHWDTELSGQQQIDKFLETTCRIDTDGYTDLLLIDSRTPTGIGGTGVSFDWNAAAAALRNVRTPVVVAGGLHAENVSDAIALLRPWGVDVATGVEAEPGRKDAAKLKAFIEKAKSVAATL